MWESWQISILVLVVLQEQNWNFPVQFSYKSLFQIESICPNLTWVSSLFRSVLLWELLEYFLSNRPRRLPNSLLTARITQLTKLQKRTEGFVRNYELLRASKSDIISLFCKRRRSYPYAIVAFRSRRSSAFIPAKSSCTNDREEKWISQSVSKGLSGLDVIVTFGNQNLTILWRSAG